MQGDWVEGPLGIEPAALHGGEGILIRLPQSDEPPLDLLDGLTPEEAETLIRSELGESALFGLRFRQNAGRALLLPRPDPSKRAPLWLQRLRAKDLLQAVRRFPDFPIVAETYRECLEDDLDLPRMREILGAVAEGKIRIARHKGTNASPFTSNLVFRFSLTYHYEWDEPKRGDLSRRGPEVDSDLLDGLLSADSYQHWLDPSAIGRVEGRLRGSGRPPRTVDEMAEWLVRLGDLAPSEVVGPMAGFLDELASQGRAERLRLEGTREPDRWISAEDRELYEKAYGTSDEEEATDTILRRFLRTRALVGLDDLTGRYPIDPAQATELLESWSEAGGVVRLDDEGARPGAHRRPGTRSASPSPRGASEAVAVPPEVFADFVARRQRVFIHATRGLCHRGPGDFVRLRLRPTPGESGRRLRLGLGDYRPARLDTPSPPAAGPGGPSGTIGASPGAAVVPREFERAWPIEGGG